MLQQILASILVTIGFGIVFNVKGKNLIYSSIGGGISWFIYLKSGEFNLTDGPRFFIATLILALYSEIIAKKLKIPATIVLIPALIPLAPGGGIYYTMYNLIEKNYPLALEKGINTFIIAGAMALGVFTAVNIIRIFDEIKAK